MGNHHFGKAEAYFDSDAYNYTHAHKEAGPYSEAYEETDTYSYEYTDTFADEYADFYTYSNTDA